jgi:hypothetical protein
MLIVTFVLGLWAVSASAQIPERTVIDNERGLLSTEPYPPGMARWDQVGFYMGSIGHTPDTAHRSNKYLSMHPDAIKGYRMVTLQHQPLDDPLDFPLQEFMAFELDEVRQGRNPLFITATYDGRSRPVFLRLSLPGG